jgi:hypothetical protein
MSLAFHALIFRRRLATRYYFFRVIVVRAVGIDDLVHKKSRQCLLNCFDLLVSLDLALHPILLQFQRKENYEYIFDYIYINTMVTKKLCIFFTYSEDLFWSSP